MVHAKLTCAVFGSAFGALVLVLLLAAASPAVAQTVDIDPTTAARIAPPSDAQRFSSEGLSEIELPGGGVAVNLEGRFKHYLVAHKGPDGKLHVGCTQNADEAHSHSVTAAEDSK